MNNKSRGVDSHHKVVLDFETLRNLSTKSDLSKGRKYHTGFIHTKQLLMLGEDSGDDNIATNVANKSTNIRDEARGRKNNMVLTGSGVAADIYSTLLNNPEDFHILNNGIKIQCSRSEVNRNKETQLSIFNPSISNGGLTHDVIRKFHFENPEIEKDALCKVDVLYFDDRFPENEFMGDEVTISSNKQRNVKEISIQGKRGILDEMYWLNDQDIARNETELRDKFDTLKLIQITMLMVPDEKWKAWEGKPLSRATIYSSKSGALKRYKKFHDELPAAKKFINELSPIAKKVYTQFLRTDIITDAKGKVYKKIGEDGYRELPDGKFLLKDGWILPIMSALSCYVDIRTGKFNMPSDEVLKGIIARIWELGYREKKNVQLLGKNPYVYAEVIENHEMVGDNYFVKKLNEIFLKK